MRTLREAASAAQSLSHSLTGEQQKQAAVISGALSALEDRLTAIEALLAMAVPRASPSLDADEAVKIATHRRSADPGRGAVLYDNRGPTPLETHIRRILG